jgi:hypothetical protein
MLARLAIGSVAFATILAAPAVAAARPFVANASGYANTTPTPDPCVLHNEPSADGHATHMGNIHISVVEDVNYCVYPITLNSPFTLTAANGDTISGVSHLQVLPNGDGSTLVTGPYTMDAGTGRFSDVTGSGTYSVYFPANYPASPAEVTLVGDVDY